MERNVKDLKLFTAFTGAFVAVLVLVPSTGAKFIALGPYNVNGATLIFPITFILNDVLTEVYGYARSRRIIWTGMACQLFAALTYWIVGIWPPAPFWHDQEAYQAVLGIAPRLTLASLTAYFCGEFANSVVISKMKWAQRGAGGTAQAWRFVASTIVGEGVDSLVFMSIGFLGVLSLADVAKTMLTLWIAKVLYEIIALPLSLRFANWVKKVEGTDQIDSPDRVNYNPFAAFFRSDDQAQEGRA